MRRFVDGGDATGDDDIAEGPVDGERGDARDPGDGGPDDVARDVRARGPGGSDGGAIVADVLLDGDDGGVCGGDGVTSGVVADGGDEVAYPRVRVAGTADGDVVASVSVVVRAARAADGARDEVEAEVHGDGGARDTRQHESATGVGSRENEPRGGLGCGRLGEEDARGAGEK